MMLEELRSTRQMYDSLFSRVNEALSDPGKYDSECGHGSSKLNLVDLAVYDLVSCCGSQIEIARRRWLRSIGRLLAADCSRRGKCLVCVSAMAIVLLVTLTGFCSFNVSWKRIQSYQRPHCIQRCPNLRCVRPVVDEDPLFVIVIHR